MRKHKGPNKQPAHGLCRRPRGSGCQQGLCVQKLKCYGRTDSAKQFLARMAEKGKQCARIVGNVGFDRHFTGNVPMCSRRWRLWGLWSFRLMSTFWGGDTLRVTEKNVFVCVSTCMHAPLGPPQSKEVRTHHCRLLGLDLDLFREGQLIKKGFKVDK